ncbi:MAG: hypothetical protein QOJ97_2605 [Solirubrobacteraceae bacterium]|jgi:hypothetical protein|nr:hypothetical protein [Solirubrobacteraceae bacterium]
MMQPRSREGDGSIGLRVERVDLVPTDLGTVIVRIAGRWSGEPVPARPVLQAGERRFDALPESSGAAERAAAGAGSFRAAFSVPEELRPSLLGVMRLSVGETEVALPAAAEIEGSTSGSPGTVVDRAVLAERRARRAEMAEESVAQRAEEAENSVAALEGELAKLELRLEQTRSERAELEAALADTAREARTAAQRAHAERRRREELVEEAAERIDEAEHDATRLRARQQVRDEREQALSAEIEALRRRVSEAEHAAAAADAARRQAEEDARSARPPLRDTQREVLAAEAATAQRARARPASPRRDEAPPIPAADAHPATSSMPAVRPGTAAAQPGDAAEGNPLTNLLTAERRIVQARTRAAQPTDLREESRRAASAVAEAAWTLAEARDAMGGVAGGVEAANAALARVEAERDALAAERERLVQARAAAEAEVRRLREELTSKSETQARAQRAIAELGSRIEELQQAAQAARRSAEAEAAVRELASAAGEALAEAERRIEDAHRAASEAQDRLDRERVDREHAEAELRSAFDRERQSLQSRLEQATTGLREDLETRIAALEADLQAERHAREAENRETEPTGREAARAETSPAEATPSMPPAGAETASAETIPAEAAPSMPPGGGETAEAETSPAGGATTRAETTPAESDTAEPETTPTPWLPAALERLAATNAEAAARLGVELLAAQALNAEQPLAYDLRVADIGWHAVTLSDGRGTVAPLESHRGRREADFRLDLDAKALARLLAAGGAAKLRRAGHAKVRGTLRRRRALRAIPAAELDLARLAAANVWPDPGLVMQALAGLVDPEWTRGHTFAVALVVLGPRGGRWRVRAADGDPLGVGPARTAEEADATVRMTQAAYQRLLAAGPAPEDRRTLVSGDVRAVALLTGWIARAQRSTA